MCADQESAVPKAIRGRVIRAAIGAALAALGLGLGFAWSACLGTPRGGGWECQTQGAAFALMGIPALIVGIPLALSALAPVAAFWRKVVCWGVPVVAVIVLAIFIGESSSAIEGTVSVALIWLLGSTAVLCLGYLMSILLGDRSIKGGKRT